MSFVWAVKAAVKEDHDYWMTKLPAAQQDAYYSNYEARYRENGDESAEYSRMQAARIGLRDYRLRGLCHFHKQGLSRC